MAFQGGRQLVTVTDVKISRSASVMYQNTSGRPLLVVIAVLCNVTLANDTAWAQGQLYTSAGMLVTISNAGINLSGNAIALSLVGTIVLMVPNGYKYQLAVTVSGNGNVAIGDWQETLLIGSTGAI